MVVHEQVVARRAIHHPLPHRQHGAYVARHLCGRRGRKRQHHGVAQLLDGAAQLGIGHALPRLGKPHVMRLVHHHEPNASATGEFAHVAAQEFRRGEHDVRRALIQAREHVAAFLRRAFAREHLGGDAERLQGFPDVEGLVGNQRAQRIHEQAGLVRPQRPARRMHLKRQRLAAPRRHDGQNGAALRQAIEHRALGHVQRAVPDDGTHDGRLQRRRILLRLGFPALAVLFPLGLVGVDVCGNAGVVGAQLGIAGGIQVAHEAEVFGIQARRERRAGARGGQGAQHGLDAAPPVPFVHLHLERGVHHTVGMHEGFDVGAVEHDARHVAAPVGKRAREVVLLGTHRTAARQRHVACQIAGNGVFLAERRESIQLFHVFVRQLVQVDAGVYLDERVEVVLGQGVHVGAQALGELRQVLLRQGHAHGGFVPAEARGQVRHRLHGLDQVHLPHAAPRSARLVALDGEQQGRHAVGVHQAAGNNALHALVPVLPRHHQGPLPVVDFRSLGLRYFGEFGLDGTALVVHRLQAGGQAACRGVVVAHEQVERQLGVTHAPGGIETRNQRKAEVGGGKLLAGRARRPDERGDAGARGGVHAQDAVGHERAVFPLHGHEVGHRAQRCQIGERAP